MGSEYKISGMSIPVWFSSCAAFLFGALSLGVPSGYSVGAALVSLAGLWLLTQPARWPVLSRGDKLILAAFLLYFGVWLCEILTDSVAVERFDKPVRIVLAAAALLWLLRYPPRPGSFLGGVALGAVLAAGFAVWQKQGLGLERAEGYTNAIQFGNLSLLLGLLALAGMGWAHAQQKRSWWLGILAAGFCGGVAGSLLSGARGGWLALPLSALVLLYGYGSRLTSRQMGAMGAAVVVLCALVYLVPATGVQLRVQEAVAEVEYFVDSHNIQTSVGARFEMWRAGWCAFIEQPLLGMGSEGFIDYRDRMIVQGKFDPILRDFVHVHNDVLDTAAKRGMLGVLVLLFLYFTPLVLFLRMLSRRQMRVQPFAAAGAVLCVCYVAFGLTQTFFSHNNGVMVYFFTMSFIWALARQAGAGVVADARPQAAVRAVRQG